MELNIKLLLLLSVFIYKAWCQNSSVYHNLYQVRDSAGRINLEVALHNINNIQAHIFCLNYNSLKYLEIQSDGLQLFRPDEHDLKLKFYHCFDNETDTENYNYSLVDVLNTVPTYSTSQFQWSLTVTFEDYAIIDSEVFFKDIGSKLFRILKLHSIGFKTTRFLQTLRCTDCDFNDNEKIDLNDFNRNMSVTRFLDISCNKIIGFNKKNLRKFNFITKIRITDFDLDNYNAFNIPSLFKQNINLIELIVKGAKSKIILHGNVFKGLKNLKRLWLVRLQLDAIQEELFAELESLESLYLGSNNIKTLNPAIFVNTEKLMFVMLRSNPIFTGNQEQDVLIDYGSRSIRLTNHY